MAIFDFRFHHPNPWIDDLLHGDHVHTNEDGEEVVSPGTPDRPVVIEPDPELDPAPNPNPAPAPAPDPDPLPRPGRSSHINGEWAAEIVVGGAGDDSLQGSSHGDEYTLLIGGPGNDILTTAATDPDKAVMIGGAGADVFVVPLATTTRIMDFQDGVDEIKLESNGGPIRTLYLAASGRANLTFDMNWIADEYDNNVVVHLPDDETLTIVNTDLADLQIADTADGFFLI